MVWQCLDVLMCIYVCCCIRGPSGMCMSMCKNVDVSICVAVMLMLLCCIYLCCVVVVVYVCSCVLLCVVVLGGQAVCQCISMYICVLLCVALILYSL